MPASSTPAVRAILLLLDSALHVVDGEPLPEPDDSATGPIGRAARGGRASARRCDGELDVSEQRYEVMYFVDLADERIEDVQARLGRDRRLDRGRRRRRPLELPRPHQRHRRGDRGRRSTLGGRPKQIRVTDLFEEVAEEHAAPRGGDARQRRRRSAPAPASGCPPVTCAVVAVRSGDGLAELFGQLGVQGVVTGGQTLNPSTAELLDAVEAVNADQVVVLPNNKNIIPVAEQVDALTTKTVSRRADHARCPRRSPRSWSTTPRPTPTSTLEEMTDGAESVATGEVTQAVRDTNSEAGADHGGRLDRARARRRHRRGQRIARRCGDARCSTISSRPAASSSR